MDDVIGYPLKEAIKIVENNNKIINIIKVTGTNKKFNDLTKAYVIRNHMDTNFITLYVSYY